MQMAPPNVELSLVDGVHGVVPDHHPIRNAWFAVVDGLVRVLTLGRGRVICIDRRAPVHWDGVIK